jgi:hypothetical protein
MDQVFSALLLLLSVGVGLTMFIFWVRMLIDCAKNEPEGNDKLVWIIVIVFTGIIGAFIYYFVRRPQRWAVLRR